MRNEKCCAGPRPVRLLSMGECRSRPCEVDGVPALFHRWIEEDRAVLSCGRLYHSEELGKIDRLFREHLIAPSGCSVDVLRETFALVEYRDGTIAKVDPLLVRFVDKEG